MITSNQAQSSPTTPEVLPLSIEMISVGGRYLCVNVEDVNCVSIQEFTVASDVYLLNTEKKGYFFDTVVGGINRQLFAADLGLTLSSRYNLCRTFKWSRELHEYLRTSLVEGNLHTGLGFRTYIGMIQKTLSNEEKSSLNQKAQIGRNITWGKRFPYTHPVLRG